MNFTELKAELLARGFNPIGDTRAGQLINWARAELDEMAPWPYREKSVTGTAPLTVSDLGLIEMVTNETQDYPIRPDDWRNLTDIYGDLSIAGSPLFYYVAWPSGVPVVATYPTNSNTIGVQYWKVTVDLTGTDTPAAPTRFHELIVDLAAVRAYRDNDNHQAAEQLRAEVERRLMVMRDALLGGQQAQGPVPMSVTGASCDW